MEFLQLKIKGRVFESKILGTIKTHQKLEKVIFRKRAENSGKKKPEEIIDDMMTIQLPIIGSMKINSIERTGSSGRMVSPDTIFGMLKIVVIWTMIIWTIGVDGQKLHILKHLEI